MGAVIEMLNLLRPPNPAHRAPYLRKLALVGTSLLTASILATLTLSVAPALAVVTKVEGRSYGVTPRSTEISELPTAFANPEGHVVVQSSNVYAIYWDPSGYIYHNDWQHVINGFLHNLGNEHGSLSNVFAVDSQYTDKANHPTAYNVTFRGAYTDTDPYPTPAGCEDPTPLEGPDAVTCVTDAQVQQELKSFIGDHKLQTGMNAIFYMLTPPGVTVCLDGGGAKGSCSDYENGSSKSYEDSFCSYHAYINPTNAPEGDSSTILYSVVPWVAGGLGDYHLLKNDRTSAYACQDGGFDPSSKPAEKKEQAKEKTSTEEEAIKKMDKEEKEKQEEKERLEGPHQQEPNQIGLGPDGSYDTGLADIIINQIAVEQQNTSTNPLLDAWQDQTTGDELMDGCRNVFDAVEGGSVGAGEDTKAGTLFNQSIGGGNYYLNDTFNMAAFNLGYPGVPCIKGLDLVPQFTAPSQVNIDELVGFDGMESDITLDAGTAFSPSGEPRPSYATYTWEFGDKSEPVTGFAPGAPTLDSPEVSPCAGTWEEPCAASVYHSYKYGGIYNVTLTVTDVGGDVAHVTEPITVVGPPEPSSSNPSGGAPSAGPSGGASPATTTSPSSVTVSPVAPISAPIPAPVLGASVPSKSLKKALSSGLPVHYTANEQVAGSIQVLLEGTLAKRLGIKGPAATGLPQGTASSIVVGTAVLVTTKAGQGTIRIKFSSRTAARLKHIHKLKVTLRLIARNASRQSPQTTTMLSTVVLNP
jgi:hypothetical protein